MKIKVSIVLVVPLLFSLAIAVVYYPGFMSYDTLHALRSARTGVTDSVWPPMVSYIWRGVNYFSTNPSAMHFSQVFVLLAAFFYIVVTQTKRTGYSFVTLVGYLCVPVILGTLAVIWKDVLMAAFFVAAYAVIISMSPSRSQKWNLLLAGFAIALIFLGTCSRHNAIVGAVPLIFLLADKLVRRNTEWGLRSFSGMVLVGVVLTGAVFGSKVQLDHYSLPKFTPLPSATDYFLRITRVLDIAGASVCVGESLFSDLAPDLSLQEVKQEYHPQHINLSKGLIQRTQPMDERVDKAWLSVAVKHPLCFFYNKSQLLMYLSGAHSGRQFLISHPGIDANEFGYSLSPSSLRNNVVGYVLRASDLFFFRPWFIWLVSLGFAVAVTVYRRWRADDVALACSSVFYLGGLVLFGNAADSRLPFYTTTTALLFVALVIPRLFPAKMDAPEGEDVLPEESKT